MPTIDYAYEIPYTVDPRNNRSFPRLLVRLTNLAEPSRAIDTDVFLDSGAEISLFDLQYAAILGLDLTSAPARQWGSSVRGLALEGKLHRISIAHDLVGEFDLEVGFAERSISRNLLGRDFFNCVQIGFRERHLTLYLTPSP